jgi:hypothetical protein
MTTHEIIYNMLKTCMSSDEPLSDDEVVWKENLISLCIDIAEEHINMQSCDEFSYDPNDEFESEYDNEYN